MSQYQPADMYEYPSDRSPNSIIRGYNGVQRQTSRHFENNTNYGGTQQGLYTADDHARYDTAAQDYRAPASTIHVSHYNHPYENQTWGGYGGGGNNAMGGTGRMKQPSRRAGIPSNWVDSPMTLPQQLPPYGGPQLNEQPYGHQMSNNHHLRHSPPLDHEELIPTAIVIKNIPFAVKKENLQDIMSTMNLPLPYAFNYHFDNGVFRGLAFANFTSPEETQRVISTMNQMELQGRKLRVEYKKMLPVAERDRIERDKRERRGQLQEQHQPIINSSQLHNQGSMNSLSSNIPATSPSPVSQRAAGKLDFDLNEPRTLDFYTQLTLFKNDAAREALVFPNDLPPSERRTIHTLAHHMGLEHRSEGSGDHRQVTIFRHRPTVAAAPHIAPHPGSGGGYYNESRRGLNRAATVDFTENRLLQSESSELFLRRQGSSLLDIPPSPSNLHQIRGAKSFADLRSFSPSPAPSTSSFPTNLAQNASRYHNEYHNSNPSGTPNLTPTSATGMNSRDDILTGMSNLGLRESSSRSNFSAAGPIGSQRPVNGQFDETSRNGATGVPQRQPKGPSASEWSQGGFSSRNRQNGHINRGSDSSDRSAPRGAYM